VKLLFSKYVENIPERHRQADWQMDDLAWHHRAMHRAGKNRLTAHL